MKRFYIIFITALLSPLLYVPAVNAQTSNKIQNRTETERNDLVFSKVETEASFPGGQGAWMKYITQQIQKSHYKKKDYGTCIVKFVVDKNGNISDVAATTMIGSRLAKVSIEAIKNGPKWKPAQQNGRFVNAWRLQPITLQAPEKTRYLRQSNYIRLKDIKKNTVPKSYNKVAVFGAGTLAVRLVLDNLYENLVADLKEKGIESDYHFLGSDKEHALNEFTKILQSENCDAVMILTQADASQITEISYLEDLPFRNIKLDQAIGIQFFDLEDIEHPIWETMVTMNFDLTRDKEYKNLSSKILKSMEENMICSELP